MILEPFELDDKEVMIPCDMRGVGKDFDGIDALIEELGLVASAEAFIRAREYFEANKEKEAEADRTRYLWAGQPDHPHRVIRPKPISALEWRQILEEEEDIEDIDEDDWDEDELGEEELGEEDPEDEAAEPPAKKPKTI
eukprot:TRINITY_DN14644_c0_g1_i2.p2 TRINITY_DN14644_c0_g1~~TRINITY_DN14644_c0_g1_i2.p2  ORF type:complete len:139 (+),score=42.98 TRINITY_DN14644_c0_g1_i2:111-527(+)